MAGYRCPLCNRNMERDLVLFLDHTQQHVIDQIKKKHPEWVSEDGACKPCAEYYEKEISGEAARSNIGPADQRLRALGGMALLLVSLVLGGVFLSAGVSGSTRLVLFFPLFFGMLGVIQAREKTCALYSEMGAINLGSGTKKIGDPALTRQLKLRGRLILLKSFLAAAFIAGLFFLLPF